MNKLPLRLCVLSALCALVSLSSALAKEKKPKEVQHHATTISSVSPTSITIAEDKAMKTFAITQFTEVTLKGQRAKVTDLQPGMAVSVTLGTDATKVSRIAAGDPPPTLAPRK